MACDLKENLFLGGFPNSASLDLNGFQVDAIAGDAGAGILIWGS